MQSAETIFAARDQIRHRLEMRLEAFDRGYRQNIGLIGRAGTGKTHLLCSLYQSLCGRDNLIPVYIPPDSLGYEQFVERWIAGLLTGLFLSRSLSPPKDFSSLVSASESLVPKTREQVRRVKKMIRREKASFWMRELFALTGVMAEETGKKIVLMIDEIQSLDCLPVSDPYALLGKEIMVAKDTFYLVSSSKAQRAREIFRDKLSLLFGNFEVLEMQTLDFQQSVEFLGARLPGCHLQDAQKKFILAMTDGEPVYLKLLADRLRWMLPSAESNHLSEDLLVEAFAHELFDYHGRIALVFDSKLESVMGLAKDGTACLRVLLAGAEGRRKVANIATYIDKGTAETKKILQRLVSEDVLVKRGAFYVLDDPLMRFWLREVYKKRQCLYTPDTGQVWTELKDSLRQAFHQVSAEADRDITQRVETLFKEFRNDLVAWDGRRVRCPHFAEVLFRPTNGRIFPLVARGSNANWFCQVAQDRVREEDVALFLEDLKRTRRKLQQKILIALGGIEQNAKLMAQEAKIQLWGLRDFNVLLSVYDLPKMIDWTGEGRHETTVGTLAQSLYPAERP
ncbi:MAG: ATP-binding protein [Candidatus Omnitrophota bacterium]|nr:ATP-binding protein [Candidatus Omnitrophota bacterium]